jgi:hypothetical protein
VSRPLRCCSALSAVALSAILAGPIASAQASDASIVATINTYAPRLLQDESVALNAEANYSPTKPTPLLKALTKTVKDFDKLAGKLKHETATTARDAKGKNDVLAGSELIATSYRDLVREIKDANASTPVPLTQVAHAVSLAEKGSKKLDRGLALLS